ncbi:MAG: hypothetical protein V3R99_11785 [Thermoguttaceae bacterium]
MTRIRSILFMALVGLSVMAIATAEAQQRGPQRGGDRGQGDRGQGGRPGGGRGFQVGTSQLLRVEKVRTEVGVTEEEWAQVQTLDERNREGMRERFAGFREMSDEERQAEMKKMGEERAKQLSIILSESKMARLNQIQLQMSGFNALGSPDVIEKLKISPGQGEKLVAIREKMQEKSQQTMEGIRGGGDLSGEDRMAQMRERMDKLRQVQKDALKEAVDTVLTPPQQETWKELTGKPFDLSISDLFQGFGRGGRGGRPGGEGGGDRGRGSRPPR